MQDTAGKLDPLWRFIHLRQHLVAVVQVEKDALLYCQIEIIGLVFRQDLQKTALSLIIPAGAALTEQKRQEYRVRLPVSDALLDLSLGNILAKGVILIPVDAVAAAVGGCAA